MHDSFAARLDQVRARIAQAAALAGRDPSAIELLPVTKTHSVEAVVLAARAGLAGVGENRVQELQAKRAEYEALRARDPSLPKVRWELIGHLQTNKVKGAVSHADRIQSIDTLRLAGFVDRAAQDFGRPMPVLLQVNAGDDPAKFGAAADEARGLVEGALRLPGLVVEGLMTIAPLSEDPAVAAACFRRLAELREDLSRRLGQALPVLSMGMSGDLDSAIASGSTLVRVGSALFGERG